MYSERGRFIMLLVNFQGKGGSYCEFRVRAQEDRSVILESVKYFGQQLTVHPNGRMGDPRAHSGDPTKQFHIYCKASDISCLRVEYNLFGRNISTYLSAYCLIYVPFDIV